jgi:hypothetical protein
VDPALELLTNGRTGFRQASKKSVELSLTRTFEDFISGFKGLSSHTAIVTR